ncbi:MAG TPA: hypothetical protein VN814_05170 [Caulobacteraceae bacterium]|nr:hypothetical protein [Caulobacteraceae bacterium]
MYVKRLAETIRAVLPVGAALAGLSLCGCNTLAKNNYFLPGGVDQRSVVAAQVTAVQHQPGPMPQFTDMPPAPTDVRPLSAWRQTVGETLADKRATDAEIREHPFILEGTEAFAASTRAKIPPEDAAAPTDATAEAEAFAASVRPGASSHRRARAKSPPPPR